MEFQVSRSWVEPLANGAYKVLRTVNKEPLHIATITKDGAYFHIMELGDSQPTPRPELLREAVEHVEGLKFNAKLRQPVNDVSMVQQAKNMLGTADVVDQLNTATQRRQQRRQRQSSNGRTIAVHTTPLTR